MAINWLSIKNEYINTSISYRKLAIKHGISFSTLKDRAIKEHWVNCKKTQHHKIDTATLQKMAVVAVNAEVNRLGKILAISDRLVSKIEEATEQLDRYIVTSKSRCKSTTFGKGNNGDKVIIEQVSETENINIGQGIIDKLGLRHIANALKDIAELQSTIDKAQHCDDECEEDGAVASLTAALAMREVVGVDND